MRVTVVSLLALLLLGAVPDATRAESPSQVAEARVPLASADSGAFVSEVGVEDTLAYADYVRTQLGLRAAQPLRGPAQAIARLRFAMRTRLYAAATR